MRLQPILVHSFVLALINFGSILMGFAVYHLLRPVNQIAVQVPAAATCCIFLFVAWSLLIEDSSFKKWSLQGLPNFLWVYAASLVWAPVIFTPLHYMTQGYLTSSENIIAGWFFQVPVNLLAVLAVFGLNKFTQNHFNLLRR
ncbi:MAG: hypothetical protein ACE5IR_06800 [bacterium]